MVSFYIKLTLLYIESKSMGREVRTRREYKVKLEKDKLDYLRIMEDKDLGSDLVCPECKSEKELVMTPYWGWGRTYDTCYFVCPKCDTRR